MPAPYCHVVDVLRKFNPQLRENSLDQNDYIGNSDREQVQARIDAVSSQWDSTTGTPMRLVRVGSPGAPRSYERHDARRQTGRFPLLVDLDNTHIVPLDANAGDALEVRTGRDSWEDITGQEGDEWVLNHRNGHLKLFRILINRVYFEAPDERYVRLTYRHGALGGGRGRGGETTLTSTLSQGATTADVEDASRLPADGGLMLIADADGDDEYVRVTDVDTSNDQLTVVRGVRATTDAEHDAGDAVHYCPTAVRDAVAAKTAVELLTYDNWVAELADADGVSAQNKVDGWESEWEAACARHSTVRKM